MGRRGPKPDYAKREAFVKLMAEGVSVSQAARTLGISRHTAKVWRHGRRIKSGGRVLELPPVIGAPAVRTYSARYLSEDERIRLADLRREKRSMREIATLLGRSPSTISRELRRGADQAGRYRPHEAHHRALQRRRVRRPSRLSTDEELREWVTAKLLARWSPEQISRELRHQFPDRPSWWLCAETIYQAVYRPDLGGLPRELPGQVLRRRRRQRLPHRDAQARRSAPIVGMTLVHERPVEVLDRLEPGHWEGDLIMGSGNGSAIVTLVERTTRFTLLGHLPDAKHDSATVRDAVVAALTVLPAHMRRTLTWDQGKEMARHAEIAAALDSTKVYFCDPHSPWQRPSNEHTNGMLRDYFPKGTDLSVHGAEDIAVVQVELNRRPRRSLDWDNPQNRFATLSATPSVLRR